MSLSSLETKIGLKTDRLGSRATLPSRRNGTPRPVANSSSGGAGPLLCEGACYYEIISFSLLRTSTSFLFCVTKMVKLAKAAALVAFCCALHCQGKDDCKPPHSPLALSLDCLADKVFLELTT